MPMSGRPQRSLCAVNQHAETVGGSPNAESPFLFVGEHLAIDFVNTEVLEHDELLDRFADFGDWVAWSQQAGLLTPEAARTMLAKYAGTREAVRALADGRTFRATLRQMCERIYAGRRIDAAILHDVNTALGACGCQRHVERQGDGFALAVLYRFERPADLLMPLANAAADVLAHLDLSLIKRCKSESCQLFFYDTSKNHTRSWCSMQLCGNREKAAAHYRRSKSLAS